MAARDCKLRSSFHATEEKKKPEEENAATSGDSHVKSESTWMGGAYSPRQCTKRYQVDFVLFLPKCSLCGVSPEVQWCPPERHSTCNLLTPVWSVTIFTYVFVREYRVRNKRIDLKYVFVKFLSIYLRFRIVSRLC